MSAGLEDIFIGWPIAGVLAIVGAISYGQVTPHIVRERDPANGGVATSSPPALVIVGCVSNVACEGELRRE